MGPSQVIWATKGESMSLVAVHVKVIFWPSTASILGVESSMVGGSVCKKIFRKI